MINPLGDTLKQLAAALDSSGIRYLIGGSVASSVRGIIRATFDIDVVAQISPVQADPLSKALGPGWYADVDQMRSSIAAGRAFNVIDIHTGNKVDIFPATEDFHTAQLVRATRAVLPFLDDQNEYPVATGEDILLAKLQWYRAGGEVSERQWNDITDLLAVNQDLNFEYIDSWAARLGVTDLLSRALADASEDT